MKKVFCLILFCLFSLAICGGEADPKFFEFTIKDRILTGDQFESAMTPVIASSLQKDTFVVELQTKFQGKGKIDLKIPPQAKKLQIFGCVFNLPPPGATAYIQTFPLMEISKPWYFFSKSEKQYAILMIWFNKTHTAFTAQLCYRGQSGRETWGRQQKYECKILPDKQVKSQAPAIPFFIKNDKLHIRLQTTGKYYKYLKKAELEVRLPECKGGYL